MSIYVAPAPPARPRRRSVATTALGNFVEYFDWLAFGLYAPFFAKQFFPSDNQVTSLLATFLVFGAGMACRPLGSILLGRMADRRGRKPALLLSIALMAIASITIGVTPTYESIGVFAPLILLAARATQGISSGGEGPSAVTYLIEIAPANRKCTYASMFSTTSTAGAFIASLLGGALTEWLAPQAMREWGWRIPFLMGGLFGIILLIARSRLTETAVFQREVRHKPTRGSLRRVLGHYWRRLLLVVMLVSGLAMVSGTWATVIPAMGHRIAPEGMMFWVIVTVTGTGAAITPLLGYTADRVGPTRFLTVLTIGFAVAAPYAYLSMVGEFGFLLFAYGVGWVLLGGATPVLIKLMTSLFPPEVRTLGIGVPHMMATAIFGGFTPTLATYLAKHGASGWFIGVLVAMVLLACVAAIAATPRFITPQAAPAPEVEPELTPVAGVR